MKNKILIGLVLFAFTLGSCDSWLDVAPDDQVNEETLFKTGEGYRTALNGVYKDLSVTSLYGREMTWGFLDVLAQCYDSWSINSGHIYDKALSYKYQDKEIKSLIQSIWSNSYNAVANCNNLIDRAQKEDPSKFAEGEEERNLIWGEALALRAFIHFDMLRLFAPSPRVVKAAGDDKGYIPYYERYGSISEPNLSVTDILSKVERDLLKAKELVGACDTIAEHMIWHKTSYRMAGGEGSDDPNIPKDLFYTYRGYRMNYYAVTALLARVYSYAGKHQEAYQQAMEVIDAKFVESGISYPCFNFTATTDFANNYKLYDELIFALSNKRMVDDYSTYTTGASSSNTRLFVLADDIYEYDSDDQRYEKLFSTSIDGAMSKKYMKQTAGSYGDNMIPMIRLSEMYYIAAEAQYKLGNVSDGISLLDWVRMKRGIRGGQLEELISDESEMEYELLKEAIKDLVCEGQAFYYYKRFNQKPDSKAEFVFPLPDNQTIH